MAKKSKKSENAKPESGGLYLHEAELALINYLTKMPDGDEVLRKAGITRHRLKVMMYDDEIYQCVEKRQDKIESAPWRLEPADSTTAQILNDHLREWWSEIVIGAQNARWFGYSVLEAVYNQNALHINGDIITPFIGLQWIGEKPMQWYEPKNDGRLILLQNHSKSRRDEECDQYFKHFLTRCKPTYENPYGEALLSRLYWVWFFKNNGFKMWAKFVEQFGMPMLVGKSAVGKNDDMRDALLRAHASRVLAVSATDTVEVTAAGSSSGDASGTYNTFDKNLERRILAILKSLSDFEQRKSELFDDIGNIVVDGIRSRWTGGEGLEGKWPLSIRVMRKGGTTLRDKSRLMNSVTHNVLADGVEIGTDVVYGPIHHFGGEIKHEARTRKTFFRQNMRTGEVGNRFVRRSRSNFMQETMGKAYTVNMSRRPWLGITEDEEQSILNSIEGVIFDE